MGKVNRNGIETTLESKNARLLKFFASGKKVVLPILKSRIKRQSNEIRLQYTLYLIGSLDCIW